MDLKYTLLFLFSFMASLAFGQSPKQKGNALNGDSIITKSDSIPKQQESYSKYFSSPVVTNVSSIVTNNPKLPTYPVGKMILPPKISKFEKWEGIDSWGKLTNDLDNRSGY